MSIHAHKTGLNKTLGQQSDAIVTSADLGIDGDCEGLIGNFIPTVGINTHYWENQEEGNACDLGNLRRVNGIGHSTTDPDHFLLDGTDDYLGIVEDGYGGTSLVELGGGTDPFTLAQWFKYNNVNHYIFFVGDDAAVGTTPTASHSYIVLEVLASNDQCKLTVRPEYDGSVRSDTATFSNFTFADDTWYYVALTHDGANDYSVYVNGSYIGSMTSTYALASSTSEYFAVECGAKNIDGTSAYSGAGTKIGHIHVYENGYLTNSQVRQNFLATHSVNNTRVYGATYTA